MFQVPGMPGIYLYYCTFNIHTVYHIPYTIYTSKHGIFPANASLKEKLHFSILRIKCWALPSQDFNAGKPSSHLIPKKGLTAWLFWWSSGCLTGWLPKKRPVSTNHHEGHPPMVRIYLPIYTWMIDVDRDQCCVHILSMGRIIWELMVNWWFGAKRFRIRPGTLKWQSLSSENPRNINQTTTHQVISQLMVGRIQPGPHFPVVLYPQKMTPWLCHGLMGCFS